MDLYQYVAQEIPQIDTEIAQNSHFQMETIFVNALTPLKGVLKRVPFIWVREMQVIV